MKTASRKEITLGLLIGLGIGIPALVLALLLSRAGSESGQDAATATIAPVAVPFDLPTPTGSATALGTPVPVGLTGTLTPEVSELPTPGVVTHTVEAGETLGGIALDYDVPLEDLIAANDIENPDFVSIGEILTIPVTSTVTQPTVEPGESGATEFPTQTLSIAPPPSVTLEIVSAGYPAIMEGDLDAAYPSVAASSRFDVHTTPDTYPEADLSNVTAMLSRALTHIETTLDAHMDESFDVYVAGSLFEPPDQELRGRSFSASRRYFFLHDGTGNAADQQYIATHEMTHVFAWNVFGRPVSAMLSEGVAVYTGMTAIEGSDHVSSQAFCRAYQVGGELPRVSSTLLFEGHIRDLANYYAAGCFVQYLIETYGTEKFGELYPTGDYARAYGKSLTALESEWRTALQASTVDPVLDPDRLLAATEAVADAYDELLTGFSADDAAWQSYLEIDAARIALLEGRFDDVDLYLAKADL